MDELKFKKLLGQRIKELRIKKKLNQSDLAEKVGIVERNLSKIECGDIFVKAKTLTAIMKALDVEPKELFDFSSLQKKSSLKESLVSAINNDLVDVDLLYRIYRSIKY